MKIAVTYDNGNIFQHFGRTESFKVYEVENNQVKIAFAQGASIFTGPPEHQKEEFHVFDAQDLVFTILDSVSSSLMEICGYDGVYFIADDGGDLAFENGGFSFVFPAGNLYEGSENGEQYLIF